MSKRYQLAETAQGDIDEIAAFIAEDDALEEAFELLAENPSIGHTREDLTDRPVKFWCVYSYLVVYDPTSAPLAILAILHGARDIEKLLKDP